MSPERKRGQNFEKKNKKKKNKKKKKKKKKKIKKKKKKSDKGIKIPFKRRTRVVFPDAGSPTSINLTFLLIFFFFFDKMV